MATLRDDMTAAGFAPLQTGGGCMAWAKHTADEKFYVLVCTDNNELGDDESDRWLVGIYQTEDATDGDCEFVTGRDDAIGTAVRMINRPENFFPIS